MAKWLVTYQTPKGAKDQTVVEVEGAKTAKEVHEALEGGSVPNAYFVPGSIIFVQNVDDAYRR